MKIEIKLNQEQFDLLLNSLVQIAQGCIRMADAWEGDKKDVEIKGFDWMDEKESPKKILLQPTPINRYTKYPGYISRDAIYARAGCGNYIAFDAALKKCNVADIIVRGHKKYIPIEKADEVVDAMTAIIKDLYGTNR